MPTTGPKLLLPWKRFWCRFGGSIHVGDKVHGFLTDPEDEFTNLYNPELFTLDQLATESCLILCGDPGIGKSTVRDDLNQRGIVIGREVQTRRGQRTDVYVDAVARGDSTSTVQAVTVVIEVKGCWNAEVRTAVDSQLVGDYLRPNGLTHGIYLVGWFVCAAWEKPQNKLTSTTLEPAEQEVAQLVSVYDGKTNPERVSGVVLDCRYPS